MKLLLVILILMLSGCSLFQKKECDERCMVKVPVIVKPDFVVPMKPVLQDPLLSKTDGELVRTINLNMIDMETYTKQLEVLLYELKK